MSDEIAATFEVADTFVLTERGLVLVGEIKSGRLHEGMLVRLPDFALTARIEGVAFARHVGGTDSMCLLLDLPSEAYDRWRQVCERGTVVLIVDVAGSA